ncbi:NAD(P)/FAD-dependent oxidoreductase [Streptomyces sp. UNOB3_S3]|uniref:FAD-dependent oxidoreductase n=1 Tax=Streptomyces sp. UNOB3_S3 TaxID=2871682 RepID=UPI001E62E1F9|nr:NAD(P)/FAD-dependent oxidoreductase [Streptomyces sp. UNOB3_S3]MCC3774679.1 FAD-dependent monooxygenase [Streptomyces sp. UNOB3_S3]
MKITPRIAVVGAGPAGLMCARVLQRHGIDVTVYDADTSADARDAGGTLDLHADSGQIALEEAGLMDAFTALARPEGQAKLRLDQHGTVLASFVPGPDDDAAPEIDRGQLRAMLAAHVAPGTVRWGHKLLAAEPLGGGVHRLAFEGGGRADADLVIGADGAWSRVRPLVSDAVPRYSGVSLLEVRFDDVERRHPGIAELVGDGHMFANNGDGQAITAQRNSDGHIRCYIGMRTAHDWHTAAGVDLGDPAAVRDFLLAEFSGWDARLLPFLTDADGDHDHGYVNRPLYALPAPLTWERTPGVTLVGDAAHLMSPFGGFGANLALLDAAELARAVAEEPTPDAAITRYEEAMFARSGPLAVGANQGLERFYTTGSHIPDHAAEHQRYKEAAAAYRRGRGGPVTAEA